MLTFTTPVHRCLQNELQARLGPDLAVICTGVDGDPAYLWPEERAAIAQAVSRRQREFAAGRAAARAAMRQLGLPDCAVPARQDRSPAWPDHLVGSISHSSSFCVAIVALRLHWECIGIDIEEDAKVEPDLWPLVCSPGELKKLTTLPIQNQKSMVTRYFSAKEAFFKWQYPQTRQMLEFHDVEIQLCPDEAIFEASRRKEAGMSVSQNHACTGGQFSVAGQIVSFVARKALAHQPIMEAT